MSIAEGFPIMFFVSNPEEKKQFRKYQKRSERVLDGLASYEKLDKLTAGNDTLWTKILIYPDKRTQNRI